MNDDPVRIEWDEAVYPSGFEQLGDGPRTVSHLHCWKLIELGVSCDVIEQTIGLGGVISVYLRRVETRMADGRPDFAWKPTNRRWYPTFDDAYAAANKWAARKLKRKVKPWVKTRTAYGRRVGRRHVVDALPAPPVVVRGV